MGKTRNYVNLTICVFPGDLELIERIQEILRRRRGLKPNKSEVIREALRMYYKFLVVGVR